MAGDPVCRCWRAKMKSLITPEINSKKIIPVEIISYLENEIEGIKHGSVRLEITIRDGKYVRYIISRDRSLLASDLSVGGAK
jgi:hypothetical protein